MKEYYSNDKIGWQKQLLSDLAKAEASVSPSPSHLKKLTKHKLLNLILNLTSEYLRAAKEVEQFNFFKQFPNLSNKVFLMA